MHAISAFPLETKLYIWGKEGEGVKPREEVRVLTCKMKSLFTM